MTKQANLIAYVFDGKPHPFTAALMQWMEASPRFTTFVEAYQDKIRKKIRVTREAESILDLRAELEVAYSLLNDRRLAVAYEPYASVKKRGPDFSITYRANLAFNIEVARMRPEGSGVDGNGPPRKEERILRILLYKLGQMRPGMPNLLVIHAPVEVAPSIELDRLIQDLKVKADGKDPAFYAASGYAGPAAFYKDFLRLNGILLWSPETRLWINKQARPELPEKVLRLVASLPSGGSPV